MDEGTFVLVTELEVRKAMRFRYPVSILALRASAGEPAETLHDQGAAEQLARVVRPLLRGTDLLEVSPRSGNVRLLLVGALSTDLAGIIRRITDEVRCHRLTVCGEPQVVNLHVGLSCFPSTATTSRDLMSQAEKIASEDRA